MKTVLLMRHAKSDWSSGVQSDHERPLNERGFRTAPKMGEFLAKNVGTPQLIISSTAKRAQQTAQLVAENAGYSGEIVTREILYSGTASNYLSVLQEVNDRVSLVLVVGHNPLLEAVSSLFLSGSENGIQVIMPTATLVCLSLETDSWKSIKPGKALLRWMKIPKMGED